MEAGPCSESKGEAREDRPPRGRSRPGQRRPRLEPFVPNTDHNPTELKSWAKRTGFNSGETTASSAGERSGMLAPESGAAGGLDLEKGFGRHRGNGLGSNSDYEPMLGRRRNGAERRGAEISPIEKNEVEAKEEKGAVGEEAVLREKSGGSNGNGHRSEAPEVGSGHGNGDGDSKKDVERGEREVGFDFFSDSNEPESQVNYKSSGLKCGLTENPGIGQ